MVVIDVTEQDIKAGWQWAGWRLRRKYGKDYYRYEYLRLEHCPVAIAMARVFGEKIIAETYRLTVGKREYRTPEIVSDWMSDFDQEKIVHPFSFTIDIENDYLNR